MIQAQKQTGCATKQNQRLPLILFKNRNKVRSSPDESLTVTTFPISMTAIISAKRKRYTDVLLTGVGLLTTILLPFYIYLQNNRFFYIDDKVADYVPKLLDIARIIKSGQFPFLSTGFMNGSIYAAEFQEGIFNPLILLSSLLLDQFNNLALGACALTSYYLLIGYVGYYLLARVLGIKIVWANIFALSAVFNCFLIYWYAAAWFNPVQGAAFLPYALWASLRLANRVNWLNSCLFVICCFLTVAAGWPAIVLMMFLFLVLVLADLLFVQRAYAKFFQNLIIYIGAGLICTLPVLPLVLSSEMFTRVSQIKNGKNFLIGSIKGLIMFSFPYFKEFIRTWGGYQKLAFSTYYVAWFPVCLLVFLRYNTISLKKERVWLLLFLTLLSALMVLGPEKIGPIRFPIRMLHYYHIFGLLLVLLLSQRYGMVFNQQRSILLLSLLFLQCVLSLQVAPEQYRTILLFFFLVVILNGIFYQYLKKENGFEKTAPFVFLASIFLFLVIYGLDTMGRGKDWNVPSHRLQYQSLSKGGGFILFNGNYLSSQKKHHEYRPATTGLIWNDKMVNGYSPLGNRLIRSKFPIQDHGLVSTRKMRDKGKEFFKIDPQTGLELLELMRVNQIISFKGAWGRNVQEAATDRWKMQVKKHTVVFDHEPYPYPGHISWLDEHVKIEEVLNITERSEEYTVSNLGESAATITFARIWWPGYSATLDEQELPVKQYQNFLLAVTIPPNTSGKLELKFTPPGFGLWQILALVGGAILCVVNVPISFSRRNNKKGHHLPLNANGARK